MIQQININDLVKNPINPRKITPTNLKRLQQSIMLFPKMLEKAKLIIVDETNTVLSGNQRTRVLQEEILAKEPFSWKVVLQENDKYASMSEHEREAVIDYWKKWCENPIVPVDVQSDLNDEQKKELIIKDNNEYGEFDYDSLEGLYDEVDLVNMGFDESIFYNPDDDPTVAVAVKGSKTVKKIDMLSFGKYSAPVTKKEYDLLLDKYEKYVDETGVDFGFITQCLTQRD